MYMLYICVCVRVCVCVCVCVRASSVLWPQHEGFEIQNVSLEWENHGILSLNSLHSFADLATLVI